MAVQPAAFAAPLRRGRNSALQRPRAGSKAARNGCFFAAPMRHGPQQRIAAAARRLIGRAQRLYARRKPRPFALPVANSWRRPLRRINGSLRPCCNAAWAPQAAIAAALHILQPQSQALCAVRKHCQSARHACAAFAKAGMAAVNRCGGAPRSWPPARNGIPQ